MIQNMKFSGYFLVVWDFIRYAKEKGIPVGPGRGSAAGSLVSYAMEITDIDPLEYGLLFERFLNPERVTLPDIDIDFCTRGRGDVIQYVTERYGREQVAQIITFGTLGAPAAFSSKSKNFLSMTRKPTRESSARATPAACSSLNPRACATFCGATSRTVLKT